MNKSNLSPKQHQSNKNPPTTAETKTAQATSAGEFIYNTMLPPQSTIESAEVPLSFISGKATNSQRSMDLMIRSDDFDFVPTGDGGVQISNAKPGLETSSDFVAQNFLFSTAKHEPLKDTPRPRPLKLERVSTGDSILKEPMGRITSSDWKMGEFRDESSSAMKQLLGRPKPPCIGSLCSGMQRMSTEDGDLEGGSIPARPPVARLPSDMSADWVGDFGREQAAPLGPVRPSLFDEKENSDRKLMWTPPPPTYTVPLAQSPATASSTRQSTKNSSSVKAKKSSSSKKKKKPKRVIDEGSICVPTDDDVLFGRGGFTNSHPGNIRFREKALEFRPVYERSSKEEKYNISQMLLEAITSEGARFLEKGQDGEWHQVIGNGARKKASQALRERMKGTPRRKGGASANLTSSLTSVKSVNSQSPEPAEAYFAQEINGDTGDVYAV